jgi:hypothetical protein
MSNEEKMTINERRKYLRMVKKRFIVWGQDTCPWNAADASAVHKCAVKNVSICPYFCGIEYLDSVLCCYPHPNPLTDTV